MLIELPMLFLITTIIEVPLIQDEFIRFEDTVTSTEQLAVWLIYSLIIYLAGLFGVLFNYKNFIVTMMAVELMYLGVITSFVVYGVTYQSTECLVYALLFLILAACESAIGLGILIVLYRFARSIDFLSYQLLGG